MTPQRGVAVPPSTSSRATSASYAARSKRNSIAGQVTVGLVRHSNASHRTPSGSTVMRTNSASHSGIPHEQHKIATLAPMSRRFGWLSYQRSGPPNRCGDGGANAGSGGPYHSEASSWGATSSAGGLPLILIATSDLKIAVELSNASSVSASIERLCSIAQGIGTYTPGSRGARVARHKGLRSLPTLGSVRDV